MTMKFRVEWLLVSILITAAAWSGVAGAVSPAAEKAILKWCQYKIDAPTNITVYAAEDARRIVDEVFLPACKGDDASKRQSLVRMKRLFAEGLAGVFSCEGVYESKPITSYAVFRRDLDFSVEDKSGDDGACKAWRLSKYCQGWRVDVLKKTGKCDRFGFHSSFLTPEQAAVILEAGPDLAVAYQPEFEADAEVEVIADVESVSLAGVRFGSEWPEQSESDEEFSPRQTVGTYQVTALVRKTVKGELKAERLIFPVEKLAANQYNEDEHGRWGFFRGMTLKLGLRRTADGWSVCAVRPALPYPPYSTENITLWNKEFPPDGRFKCCNLSMDVEVSDGLLAIQYGDHTFVRFIARSVAARCFDGEFPDYGGSVVHSVYLYGAGSDTNFWADAWFTDGPMAEIDEDEGVSEPRVRNATDGLCDEDLVRFCWWGRELPSVSFRPPATLADVADFFTAAMKPCGCSAANELTLVVTADPAVAQRKVRAFSATDIEAFDGFSRVVAAAGCRFTAEGTNVTIVADIDESDLSVPRVADLERLLAAEGFASVADAEYANVYYRVRDTVGSPVGYDSSCFLDDLEAMLMGDGWVRPAAGGREAQVLAFESVWWGSEKGWRTTERQEDDVTFEWSKARLRRDTLKMLDALKLWEREGVKPLSEDDGLRALSLALHLHQRGETATAQEIVDLLYSRPKQAKESLELLRELIRVPTEKGRTVREWAETVRKEAAAKEAASEDEDDEEDDE